MKKRSSLGSAFACLALAAAGLAPCGAEGRLEASLGFGGCAPPERWVPLRIRAAGEVPPGASIRVERLDAEGLSLGYESFPALGGLLVECPAWTGGGLDALTVSLGSGGAVLAETRLSARAKPFPGHLVLAFGLPARARLAIASALLPVEPVLVVAAEALDLPANGLDYDAVSAIAIGGAGIDLSPAQRGALLAWLSGGGKLCAAAGPSGAAALEGLGLRAGRGPGTYGLGRFAAIPPERAEDPAAWREALALAPYDPASRVGAGSLARSPAPLAAADARGARGAIAAASGAWILALLAAALLGKGRPAPFAAVSAVCLAAVLAGGPALDAALRRGAGIGLRALVLPGSGAAFVALDASEHRPTGVLEWTRIETARSPLIAYGDEEEGGFDRWRHFLARAAFGLRLADGKRLSLEAMLEPDGREEAIGLPAAAAAALAAAAPGGAEPPLLDSPFPLAFLAPGEGGRWWEKNPNERWAKSESIPSWLEGDAPWILPLRGADRSRAVLAGSGDALSLGLEVSGGRLRELRWAMPLGAGGKP